MATPRGSRGPAWAGSTRRARLPKDWYTRIRPAVLRRDGYQCRLRYRDVCVGFATHVDHIRPGDDHRPSNLQAACEPCHQLKSAREGAAARPRLRRPPDPHPGLS